MTISEFTCIVDSTGSLVIEPESIAEMGLRPGELVHIAYISEKGVSNDYREFLISKSGVNGIEESESSFQIPTSLLEQANISTDSDLQIACFDGLIIVCRSSVLEQEEYEEILERLKTASRFSDFFSDEDGLDDIKSKLADTIHYFEERKEEQ